MTAETVSEIVARRGISEILHFTTQPGLVGILHQGRVKARKILPEDEALEFILSINTPKVFDPNWKDYVNLSITRININLFGYSQGWHPNHEWRVLSFNPEILAHAGVHFVTTNNAYWQHLRRGVGPQSLERLFSRNVNGRMGKTLTRSEEMPNNWTTDVQAEVLYPRELSTDYLRKIYVRNSAEADLTASVIAALQHRDVPIVINEELFQ